MTGRIVTGPDGTRYRHSGEWRNTIYPGEVWDASGSGRGVLFFAQKPDYGAQPIVLSEEKEVMEPLPHIPNWPLPGPAPQYLSDDPDTPLGPKDLYVNKTRHGWAILENGSRYSIFRQHRTLGEAAENSIVGERAWLIARADPTEDAE